MLTSCFPDRTGYFVDVAQPRAEVVAHLKQKAVENNSRSQADLAKGEGAQTEEDRQQLARIVELDVQLASVYAEKVTYVARRLLLAKTVHVQAIQEAETCRSKILKAENACDEIFGLRDGLAMKIERLK